MTSEFTHVQTDEMLGACYRQNIYPYYCPFILYDEVFVQISSFMPEIEGYFWISNYGRAFNSSNGYLVTPTINRDGYVMYSLRRRKGVCPGKSMTVLVFAHVLTCRAFNGPKPSPAHQVNHKDFNRTNNYYTNLEWLTHSKNLEYSRDKYRYWDGEAYSSSKYPPEKIHELCRLLESGITDPETLTMMVFGEHVSPKYYALIQDMRTGSNWSHISSQYNVPPLETRNFTDDRYIHMMCKYLSEHPGSFTNPLLTLKDILMANGLHPGEVDPKLRRRLSSALNQLRYKGAYKRIASQYTFT